MVERVQRPRPCGAAPYVGPLVLTAFAGMSLQVVAMGYGRNMAGPPTFWILIGTGLLMLVQVRRSRFARGLLLTTAVLGACLYVPGISHLHSASIMFAAFTVQALAMAAPPVRRHVEGPVF